MLPQATLTLLGLACDFLGFCLLLREWWVAFLNERHQVDSAEQEATRLRHRDMRNQHIGRATGISENPHATLDRMVDQMHANTIRSTIRQSLQLRRFIFVLASVLIIVGFILQFLGALPGCCPAIAIGP